MKYLQRLVSIMIISTISISILSCDFSGDNDKDDKETTPVQTIRWEPDEYGFIQFMTNDPKYYKARCTYTYGETDESTMTTVTASIKKNSGYLYAGFGIKFCNQDALNYYCLIIDLAGHYSVYKNEHGNDIAIIPWTTCSTATLNEGYGATNIISVTQTSLNNFQISINGIQETTFNDTAYTGGQASFYVKVAEQENENFPDSPVDVRFKLSSPITYP